MRKLLEKFFWQELNIYEDTLGVGSRQWKDRLKKTVEFIGHNCPGNALDVNAKVLDIAGPSNFGREVQEHFDWQHLFGTCGVDLNYSFVTGLDARNPVSPITFELILCLEVMEHLLNPALFLRNLHEVVDESTQIVITYPSRPLFLWTNYHFHEMRRDRMEFLLNETGYRVVKWQNGQLKHPVNGIRPILRQFCNWWNMVLVMKK